MIGPFSYLDVALLAVAFLSGLLAMYRGLTREVLSILSWAVAAGTVIRAGYVRGFGQMVMVQHGTFSTLYAHASSLRVTVDQAVKAGDALGTVGTTGLADDSSPVLHFELRYNGTPQDPTDWLAP